MQETPSTPDALKLDIGPDDAEVDSDEALRSTRVNSNRSLAEVRHGHRMPAPTSVTLTDSHCLPGRHTCSLPPWCEA